MMSDAVSRWARALTLPSVLFTTALAGHAVGDGAIPAASVLALLFVLTVVSVAPFTMVPITPARTTALLLAGQGLLHTALQLLGGTTVTATTAMCGTGAGAAAVSSPTSCHLMAHPGAMSHDSTVAPMGGGHLVMLLAHMAAAVVVGVWLAVGERALSAVLLLATRPVVDAWRTITGAARGTDGAVVLRCPRLQLGWGLRCVIRGSVWAAGVVSPRGPPGVWSPEPYVYAAVSTV
jgi:hypothetical protein